MISKHVYNSLGFSHNLNIASLVSTVKQKKSMNILENPQCRCPDILSKKFTAPYSTCFIDSHFSILKFQTPKWPSIVSPSLKNDCRKVYVQFKMNKKFIHALCMIASYTMFPTYLSLRHQSMNRVCNQNYHFHMNVAILVIIK